MNDFRDHDFSDLIRTLSDAPGAPRFVSLPALAAKGYPQLARLPVSLRIVLESLARNCDGLRVTAAHVHALAGWQPDAARVDEVPFMIGRVLLQDMSGVPVVMELAAMREVATRLGRDASLIEPVTPVDFVVDHSVQVDHHARPDAVMLNMKAEFERNGERYGLIKWSAQAFRGIRLLPPGIGIVHQLNIEYLSPPLLERDGFIYPDSVVGTDSHTTMVNGIGVVGWGVGGIEAIAAILGQPVCFLTPDVVGVELTGQLPPGVTATDLVLTLTEWLRAARVVGAFVEYFGDGAAWLSAADRCTIANMAPDYGATMGFFAVDEKTLDYLAATGKDAAALARYRAYLEAQGLFGTPTAGAIDYTRSLRFDLASVTPSVAGPKRPQDRIELPRLKSSFDQLLAAPVAQGGYGKALPDAAARAGLAHGDIVLAAITSCTNTSNPAGMIAAGLLAKKAVERGLTVPAHVKTALAPGSRVVTGYLERTGLQPFLDQLGFGTVAYGCTVCMGGSGPLAAAIEQEIRAADLIAAAVLSGNRNFEARIHPSVKGNFLMSPALVVAFAIAGTVRVDVERDPLGIGSDGQPVFLRDLWPAPEEIAALLPVSADPALYRAAYSDVQNAYPLWQQVAFRPGPTFDWDERSTWIRKPPYFNDFTVALPAFRPVRGARALAILGDSVTTDHVSPVARITAGSPAGDYLATKGERPEQFDNFGTRRGNHEVMMRGGFAHSRLRNRMLPGSEGGVTVHHPDGEKMSMYDCAMRYRAEGVPLVVLAGAEYGTGSSRDWAAKAPMLLGVRAVVAQGFERIHRSNLVGMGVLPLQFEAGNGIDPLALDGSEAFDIEGLDADFAPRQAAVLAVTRRDGRMVRVPVRLRIDTEIEAQYFRHGGILQYVLRQWLCMPEPSAVQTP